VLIQLRPRGDSTPRNLPESRPRALFPAGARPPPAVSYWSSCVGWRMSGKRRWRLTSRLKRPAFAGVLAGRPARNPSESGADRSGGLNRNNTADVEFASSEAASHAGPPASAASLPSARRRASDSLLVASLKRKQVSSSAVMYLRDASRALFSGPRSAAGDGTRRVPWCPRRTGVRSRARAGIEQRFASQGVITVFPRVCPSPWYRRASGTSLKA
jgi:hypothetical protein